MVVPVAGVPVAGGGLGAWLGATYAVHKGSQWLRYAFIGMVVLSSIKLILQ